MKTSLLKWQLPTLALIATASYAWAEEAGGPAVVSELNKVQATVQAVYPDKRSLTLVGPSGKPQTIFAGSDVQLDRLHAGDKVNVSYYEGVAAQIAKGDTKLSDPAAADFAYKNPMGAMGGGAGSSVTATVKILGIDLGTNTVAFQDADGSQHVIKVKSPEMKKFIGTLQPGDVVDITYTDSVAVSVTPVAKKG